MNLIRTYVDYPSKDVCFRHIEPLLNDAKTFNKYIEDLLALMPNVYFNTIGALDARGFIIGAAIQSFLYHRHRRNVGLFMVRKAGKLPGEKTSASYSMEYGEPKTLEVSNEAVKPGDYVLLVDDLLATGGTLNAARGIVELMGATVTGCACLIQLEGLRDESFFSGKQVVALFKYPATQGEGRLVTQPKLYRSLKTRESAYKVVMWHPSLESIALKTITQGLQPCHVHWDSFSDGWCNITFTPDIQNRCVMFLLSLANKEIFAEQLALLVALPRQGIASLKIFVPFLGPGTHERVRFPGMLATVEPMLKALTACLPMTKSGPATLHILDIHALQEQFYVVDNVHVKLESAIPLLKAQLKKFCTVAFPDDGAYKRFSEQFKGHPMIICGKMRNGDTREVRILDYVNWPKEYSPTEVIVVDDLVQSGETMIKCVDAIKARFPDTHVDGYATHAVFPNEAWRKVIPKFRTFYLTNSNPGVSDVIDAYRTTSGNTNIKILGVEQILRKICGDVTSHRADHELYKWYVASTNKDKLQAVQEWTGGLVYAVDGCTSGVPEQPVGLEQTTLGAQNRLKGCPGTLHVAVENGIVRTGDDQYEDVAVVIVAHEPNTWTGKCGVAIPREYNVYVEAAIQDPTKTFGSRVEEAMGFPTGTWHERLCDMSRVSQIETALRSTRFLPKCLREW
jgi:adenine phosphoribosyltransferase